MKNFIQQPQSVKNYLVNALQGIGLCHNQPVTVNNQVIFPEMNKAEILAVLESPLTDSAALRKMIDFAIMQQYRNDAISEDSYLKQGTAFDRQTVKQILSTLGANDQQCTYLTGGLGSAGANNATRNDANLMSDKVAELVINTMKEGVSETAMPVAEREAVSDIWDDVLYCEFKQNLINLQAYDEKQFNAWRKDKNNHELDSQYEGFCHLRLQKNVRTLCRECFNGNDKICDEKIKFGTNSEFLQQLKANDGLYQKSISFCKKRLALQNKIQLTSFEEIENELTFGDVLASAGNEKEQVITFFQTRSAEQQILAKAKNSQVSKENKIGNLIGKKGREYLKKTTGSSAVVDYDVIEGLKSGKKGPWRGYKALYDRIANFFESNVFYDIQAVGLTQGIIERKTGYSFVAADAKKAYKPEKDPVDPTKTDFKEIPDEYIAKKGEVSNLAQEFYARTKARLLYFKTERDRMMRMAKEYRVGSNSLEDKEGKFEQTKYALSYLEACIGSIQNVLATKMPDKSSADYNNPQYFLRLDQSIATIQNEMPDDVKAFVEQSYNIDYIENGKANEYVRNALSNFLYENDSSTKRAMAQDVFDLGSQVASGNIDGKNLDNMTNRFFESAGIRNMYYDLTFPKDGVDVNKLSVAAMMKMNTFAVKDLQSNALKNQYEQYQNAMKDKQERENIARYHDQIAQNVAAELQR